MENVRDSVMSQYHLDKISNLLEGTDFNGVTYNKFESLLEFGFIFDERIGKIIVTEPIEVWDENDTKIRFAIADLSLNDIDDAFNLDSEFILTSRGFNISQWDEMCHAYKINYIEMSTGGLNLSSKELTLSCDDLINYLETIID